MASSQTRSKGNLPMYPITWEGKPNLKPLEQFISTFYRVSDVTGDIEQWVKLFTEDAVVKIGDSPSTPDQIALKDLRATMWNGVKTREHAVTRVIPAKFPDWPEDDLGFAAFGSVKIEAETITVVDGHSSLFKERDWSAYGQLKKEDGIYKLAHYEVYFGGQRSTSS
ncbi:hypothetical protein BR93DRAFT_925170 [Coniochaeta sp. PMI_546]|nr:hypothetical protein BR93DRAFT_925170 [Coniochaeta sp. PMI_546]